MLHGGRTHDRITLAVKLGKTRKSRKFRERWWESRDLRVVRHCSPAGYRTGAKGNRPGIEFNAHCYQRREDATQPHCLAVLVTAGDIINRLRAPHLHPRPLQPPTDFVASGRKLANGRRACGGENILYFLSENITVSWLRGIWLSPSIELAENRILEVHHRRASAVSAAFIKRMNLHKESILNLQEENNGRGKIKFFHGFECHFDSM